MSKHGSFRQAAGMLNIVISVCLLFSGVVFAAGGSLPGTGDPNDPYLIEDLADFDAFA